MQMIVSRTVAIDDAVHEHAVPQVVIIGAGLDSRARRMTEQSTMNPTMLGRQGQIDQRPR